MRPKGKVVSKTSRPDPWYGNNITWIVKTKAGKYFRYHGNDMNDDTYGVEEVKPKVKTETIWEKV